MQAAKFVGRVGGLAVALGVGVAVFNESPAAWADGVSRDSGATGSGATGSARPDQGGARPSTDSPSRRGRARASESVAAQGLATPQPSATLPASRTPRVQAPPAAVAARVVAPAAASALPEPVAPLAWTTPAFGRRKGSATPTSAATRSVFGNSITVNPDVAWKNGLY